MSNLSLLSVIGPICFCAGLGSTAWISPIQIAESADPLEAIPKAQAQAQKPPEGLPIGLVHDFGKIKYGESSSYSLPIVNTSGVPLRLTKVRAASANHLSVSFSEKVIKHGDVAKLDIRI